jgi:hypothetical protein
MKKAITILLVLVAFGWLYSQSGNHSELKEGDVVFQISQSKQSPLIAAATGSQWTHCGVIVMKKGEPYVLEAASVVKLTPWEQWKRRGKGGITSMKRYTDKPVKIRYSQYLGKPYDLAFKFDNGKWYCSELVYDIYLKQLGVKLCEPQPISDYHLVVMDKTMQRRGISRDQLAVAPVDLFYSKLLH